MKQLLNRLFPNRAELDELAEQNESLRQAEAAARQRENEHHKRESALRAELRQAKEKLRDQTDADLLLISQRITAKIIEGDKPEDSAIAEQRRLMAQRQALQSQAAHQRPYNDGGLNALLGSVPFGFQ